MQLFIRFTEFIDRMKNETIGAISVLEQTNLRTKGKRKEEEPNIPKERKSQDRIHD